MIALVDCNNFYASCQRVFDPTLNGKAIVVLSNNDGCVIARSNEAKAVGVPMGAPAFKFKSLFKQHGVKVFSANFPLYGDMSKRVMDILSAHAPEIEVYSIDEAFLNFEGCSLSYIQERLKKLQKLVYQSTGIPISIGFAPTKALSKVANKIAKKYPQHTQHVYGITTEAQRIKALKWTKIEDVWGIGRRHAQSLQGIGVHKAMDFTLLEAAWVRRNFSVVGLRLYKELKGEKCLDLEKEQLKKSIATTRSFDQEYTLFSEVKERVISFTSKAAEKLRKQKKCCTTMVVFIRGNTFNKNAPFYGKSIHIDLPFPTQSTLELSRFAVKALKMIFKEGFAYKKAGVILLDFIPQNQVQLSLFQNPNLKHLPLMKVLDKINFKYGNATLRIATQDKKTWKMKQAHLSPQYTTNIKDILTVKV